MQELESSYIADESVKGAVTLDNRLVVTQNVKHRVTIQFHDFTKPRKNNVFILKRASDSSQRLLIIATIRKQLIFPSTSESINKCAISVQQSIT